MANIVERAYNFVIPLSPAQRFMFLGLVLVILISLGYLFYWALKPDYSLLFGSMQPNVASEIVEQLESEGVRYMLENDGRSILVPTSQVHSLRLKLASKNLFHSDIKGYELFDENALGMTDFMQQVNKKRALEGELARSINSLDQVETSRIHLVLPERRAFQQASVEASASVILNLKSGTRLNGEQVKGIVSLISGSVEGLNPEAVVILDQAGNRLTDGINGNLNQASGTMQKELRVGVETYLTERTQSMLDRALGHGNSMVRVSVEHDFDKIIRESELIDPDSRTIISEERRSENTSDQSSQQVPFDEFTPIERRGETVIVNNRSNESTIQTRNYDVNRIREIHEKSQGEIKRISASVLLNHKQVMQEVNDGQMTVISQPYSQNEINEFRDLVRVALGIQPGRGDELTIIQFEFHDPTIFDTVGLQTTQPIQTQDIIRWVIILITALIIVFMIFTTRKKMSIEGIQVMTNSPNNGLKNVAETDYESYKDQNESGQSKRFIDENKSQESRKQLKEKTLVVEEIKDYVELKPREAAQVVRAMMT